MNPLRAIMNRLFRRRPEDISDTIADARRAAEAMNRTTPHNPDALEADLRYLAGGPGTP
jgi:hypothetical protein